MKMSLARADLQTLLRAVSPLRLNSKHELTLSACSARVFAECEGNVAGIETLVLLDGSVTLPFKSFRDLLKTYVGQRFLHFEGDANGLYIHQLRIPVTAHSPNPQAPGEFRIFQVTDDTLSQEPLFS